MYPAENFQLKKQIALRPARGLVVRATGFESEAHVGQIAYMFEVDTALSIKKISVLQKL